MSGVPPHIPRERIASVLEGAPSWITQALIADTQRIWQPYYDQALTEVDALGILLDVGQLLDLLEDPDE